MNIILKAYKYALSFILLINSHMAYSLVMYVPIDELSGRSDYIAVGTVESISTRMGPRKLMIWTDYHLKVSQWYKGSGDNDLIISFAGGEIDGRSIAVSETISLTKGKEYIVFGYDSSKHYSSPTVGVSQGVFQVIRNSDSPEALIVDFHGYQMELSNGQLKRGRLTETDKKTGKLRYKATPKKRNTAAKPTFIFRDSQGNKIPQKQPQVSASTRSVKRVSGEKLTLPMFGDYVNSKIENK